MKSRENRSAEKYLSPGTSAHGLGWQPFAAVMILSVIIHMASSPELGWSLAWQRVFFAAISVVPMYAIIWATHRVFLKKRSGRAYAMLASYVVGGSVRGLTLAELLSWAGLLEREDIIGRAGASSIFMAATAFLATFSWAVYRNHMQTVRELNEENLKLSLTLEQLEKEVEGETLAYISGVSEDIVDELSQVTLSPIASQIAAIQRIIDESVRPLSRTYAKAVQSWRPFLSEQDLPKASRKLVDVEPVTQLPPAWIALVMAAVPFPTALVSFGLPIALELAAAITILLTPSVFFGFRILRSVLPAVPLPWRGVVFTIAIELIGAPAIFSTWLVLGETTSPDRYVLGGIISFPIYVWMIVFSRALLADLKDKEQRLIQVRGNLRWAIARVNLLSWHSRGVVTRLLHGPIQNAMHATLMKLRNAEPKKLIEDVIRELGDRIRSSNPITSESNLSLTKFQSMLSDTSRLWEGVAQIGIAVKPEDIEKIVADRPGSAILLDLINEACSNAIRHGGAQKIGVDVLVDDSDYFDKIMITITDDGPNQALEHTQGLGQRFLDNCSLEWGERRILDRNRLVVSLPLAN